MKISYAITVCNEATEIQTLVSFLLDNKRLEDEIVILFDSKNGTKGVEQYLRAKSVNSEFAWHAGEFDNHFADWKNKLTGLCSGDYIFQIDADEVPNTALIKNLPTILECNPNNEVYLVPRVNTVEGLTDEHINKWRWNVNENNWVNWPDYQMRIYRNIPQRIKWIRPVHEILEGYKTYTTLPDDEAYCLYHPKEIKKQEKQNKMYEKL